MTTPLDTSQLAAEFAQYVEWRTKSAGGTPTSASPHGPGGILSMPGQRPQVISAMVMPRGLYSMLPAMKSVFANEVYPILTGQTAASGENPSTACGGCKTPGKLQVCNQTWPFGRWCMDSSVIRVDDLGILNNRSEFIDQTLVGNPFLQGAQPPAPFNPQTALRDEKSKVIMELFVEWVRAFSPQTFTGNPANNTVVDGKLAYGEPYGLDIVLNTGYVDTYTRQRCPAADPLVLSASTLGITEVGASASATVQAVIEMYSDREKLAKDVGLGEIEWAFVGRYSLFRRLTEVWPCNYATYQCAPANATQFLVATENNNLRDDMRNNNYLLINGKKVQFIEDNTITETIPTAGTAQSDLYLVPLRGAAFSHNPGGVISYWQFFDMNSPVNIVNDGGFSYPLNTFQAIGGGRYLVYPKAPANTCIQYGMVAKQRLIVEAPFLGARLTGLKYTFFLHERNFDPNNPYYFYDGGQYQFSAPYFYPPQ